MKLTQSYEKTLKQSAKIAKNGKIPDDGAVLFPGRGGGG